MTAKLSKKKNQKDSLEPELREFARIVLAGALTHYTPARKSKVIEAILPVLMKKHGTDMVLARCALLEFLDWGMQDPMIIRAVDKWIKLRITQYDL